MNILRAILYVSAVAVLNSSGIVLAQSTSSGLAESYLQRSVGARAIGLGGAYTAIANEPIEP